MGQPDENLPGTPGTSPVDPPQQQQQNHTPSPQPETQQGPPQQRVRGDDILAAIEAIPEKVISGFKETMPKPRAQRLADATKDATKDAVQQVQQAGTDQPQTPPAKKSFADWWFN